MNVLKEVIRVEDTFVVKQPWKLFDCHFNGKCLPGVVSASLKCLGKETRMIRIIAIILKHKVLK